jgi:hypothetical protein
MNFHDHSMTSVCFWNGSEVMMCADSKNISKNPAPLPQNYKVNEIMPCTDSDIDYSGAGQKMSSGKTYEASMVIL